LNAEIVSTGTELLLGRTLNTSAYYLTEQLSGLGIEVAYHTTVGDNRIRLKNVLEQALLRTNMLVVSGGLGPTKDDMTKEILAEVLNLEMVLDRESIGKIKNFYPCESKIPVGFEKQAYFPQGSKILPNISGTAPGAFIENKGKIIILLPGPPVETEQMFNNFVIPELKNKFNNIDNKMYSKTLKVFGLEESELDKLIEKEKMDYNITLLDKHTYMDLRIVFRSSKEQKALQVLGEAEDRLRKTLGKHIFTCDEGTHAGEIGKMLKKHNITLSTAESCTGGLLGGTITNEAGSSDYYLGGVVSYSNFVKEKLLGVNLESLEKFGAVSKIVAREMAEGVKIALNTDIAIAVTGVAGPGGGSLDKPVGLVYIALASCGITTVQRFQFVGNRQSVRNMTVESALDMLRRYLLSLEE